MAYRTSLFKISLLLLMEKHYPLAPKKIVFGSFFDICQKSLSWLFALIISNTFILPHGCFAPNVSIIQGSKQLSCSTKRQDSENYLTSMKLKNKCPWRFIFSICTLAILKLIISFFHLNVTFNI